MAVVLALLAGAWLALLCAAPLLPAPISAIAYALGSLVCHQRPERSFHLDAYQLPVCARCIGIYAGAAIGAVSGLPWRPNHRDIDDTRVARHDSSVVALSLRFARTHVGVTLLASLPTAVTVALEWLGVWYPSNLTRAVAGAPLGLVVMGALATLHYGECVPPRPTAPSPPPPSI